MTKIPPRPPASIVHLCGLHAAAEYVTQPGVVEGFIAYLRKNAAEAGISGWQPSDESLTVVAQQAGEWANDVITRWHAGQS